jgi:hypothetical protein
MNEEERDRLLMKMHGTLSSLDTRVAIIERSVRGNGRPGLNDRLVELETKFEEHDEKVTEAVKGVPSRLEKIGYAAALLVLGAGTVIERMVL